MSVTGVVLAGGRGTRLAPLTDRTSKQLLPVGGRALIERVIGKLVQAGVEDVLLVIDERHASQFMGLLEDGGGADLRSLAYVWQPAHGSGLPSAIRQVRHHLTGDKFLVACGDVLFEDGIKEAVDAFRDQESGARIITVRTPDTAGYSPLRVAGDRVLGIGDKNRGLHTEGHIDLGYYLYHSEVFDLIEGLRPSDRGETEIWDLNRIYVSRRDLRCSIISGWWADVGESIETYRSVDGRYADAGV